MGCGLPDFVAGESDMKIQVINVCDLRCGLPKFVAGKIDVEMQNVPKSYFQYKFIAKMTQFA